MSKKKKSCLDCIHAGKLFGPYVFCKLAQENHEYDKPCSLFERQTIPSNDGIEDDMCPCGMLCKDHNQINSNHSPIVSRLA